MRYQKVFTQIWHDEKFCMLSEDAKTLFIYMLTCPHGNAIGVFVLPDQYAVADLKWDLKRYAKPFRELIAEGMILHDPVSRLICIKNHLKHNPLENENQAKAASKIVASLPKSTLYSAILKQLTKQYHEPLLVQLRERYAKPETGTEAGTGTEAVSETGTETGTETDAGKPAISPVAFEAIVQDLNSKTGKEYKHTSKQTRNLIQTRWNDGFRQDDFFKVHSNMAAKWLTDPKMQQYLRPETLYGTKFESYLNTQVTMSDQGTVSKITEKNITIGKKWLEKQGAPDAQS